RHTRFSRDWSSDVCSSDLAAIPPEAFGSELRPASWQSLLAQFPGWAPAIVGLVALFAVRGRAAWDRTLTYLALLGVGALVLALRSEERRVGEECGSRSAPR